LQGLSAGFAARLARPGQGRRLSPGAGRYRPLQFPV